MAYNKLGVEVVFGSGKIRPEILEILDAIPSITLAGHTGDPETFPEKIRATADLILVELSEGVTIPDWLWNITQKISPGAIILCAPRWNPDFLIQATQAGFHSFLTMPFSRTELEAIINKIELKDEPYQPGRGKVIVVTGYKGGVGVTTVAINLAMALGKNANDKVALVDLGIPFPDVARFIDKEVSYSLYEAVEHGGNLDVSFLKKLMQPYDSNLDILNGYVDVGGTYRLETNAFKQIVTTLRRMYNYIIIDLGQSFDQLYMEVIKQSDLVLILSGLTIADLKNIKATWPMFTEWSEGAIKLKVVVNRLNKGNNIQINSLEEIIRGPVFESLPSDYHLLVDAQFQGAPLAVTAPRSKLWHKIEDLAEKVQEQLGATSEELEVSAPEIPARAQTGFSWQSPRGIMLAALSLTVVLLVILVLNFFFKKQQVPQQAMVTQETTKMMEKAARPSEVPPQAKVIQKNKQTEKLPAATGGAPGTTVTPAPPGGKTAAPAPETSMAKDAGNAAAHPAVQGSPAAPQVQTSEPGAPAAAEAQEKSKYVGSITSNKYHYPDCKWAKTIPHRKLMGFNSVAEAKEKGYIPCPACNPPQEDPAAAAAGNSAGQGSPAAPEVQAAGPGAPEVAPAHENPKYVGSSTSNKYHYPDCKWAKTILPEKVIGFKSVAEAKEKGYIPCPACKPPRED
jgi:pilus assembly protein CpaE